MGKSYRCCCITKAGKRCRNISQENSIYCWVHADGKCDKRAAVKACRDASKSSKKRSSKSSKSRKQSSKATHISEMLGLNPQKARIARICLNGFTLKKRIADGSFGSVFSGCDLKDNCTYAVKVGPINDTKHFEYFEEEVRLSRDMYQKYGIGPRIYGGWYCDGFGFIVTERWNDNLRKYYNKLSPEMLEKLKTQIRKIHDAGFIHGDILRKNVFVKLKKGKVVDITVGDFGTMQKESEWPADVLEQFYDYHKQSVNKVYFKDKNITAADVKRNPKHLDVALYYFLRQINM